MMEVAHNVEKTKSNIFTEFKNISLIDLMCLNELVDIIDRGGNRFSYIDYAYEIFTNYWDVDLSKVGQTTEIKLFNEVKNMLMNKYGLYMDSTKIDVIQILKLMNDKQVNIKLLGIMKKSLNYLKNPFDERKLDSERLNYWNSYLISEWKCHSDLLKIVNQKEVSIDKNWVNYIKSNKDIIYDYCSYGIDTLLKGESLVIKVHSKNNQSTEDDFSILDKLEKRIEFHQVIDKKIYSCLEVAFEFLNFTSEDYLKYKLRYDIYVKKYDIKRAVLKYPFVTSLLLIYTSIYRYNDENSNGYWPEFFGESDYQYKDAVLAMGALIKVVELFKINAKDRHYLEKVNLSEIFSQIYIPEVSIRKIYSAIYKYYFKGSNNQRIVNALFFLEDNMYRLDKPGKFFLSKDELINNSFDKIIKLFHDCLNNKKNIETIDYLPKRFLTYFEKWLELDKVEIDSQKEEYYIASPRIRFDIPNEKMILILPQQRSKVFSDENCGWNIFADNSVKKFVNGRIIKRKDGVYIILDEEIELSYFENLNIEYVFNDKVLSKWQFENTKPFILFNEHGYYLKIDKLSRSKYAIGISNAEPKSEIQSLEKVALNNWKGYIFYYLDLENFNERQLIFYNGEREFTIEIDDQPSIKRSSFKLAFEKWDVSQSNFEGTSVYEDIGTFSFYAPNLSEEDIEVNIRPIFDITNFEYSNCYVKRQMNQNNVEISFNRNKLLNGYYSLLIRYKERTILRENFILIDKIDYFDEFDMSYQKINQKHKKLILKKNLKYQIEPSHITCFVSEDDDNYYIEPSNVAKVKFNLLVHGISVPIVKTILPIRWNITGLESVIDNKNDNQVKEITKEALDHNDIRLQVSNFDYRYQTLTYKLKITEKNNNKSITEIRKLGYGDQFSFLFDNIKDRLIEFHNITIKMFVINEKQEVLYEKIILNVVKKIKMLNFNIELKENNLNLSWDEKYYNKSRILKLCNYINPWKDSIEFELEDGSTQAKVPLDIIDFGCYIPILDYKKEISPFDNVQERKSFFKKNELRNIIIIDKKIRVENEDSILGRLVSNYTNGKFDNSQLFLDLKSLDIVSNSKVIMTLIQMRYLIDELEQIQVNVYIKNSFELLNLLINRDGFEKVIDNLLDMTYKLSDEDIRFCITMLLATRKDKTISNEKIDLLSEINVINALCCVKNGSGVITNNLKSRCVSSFERELLGMARKYKEISSVVKNEIEIINSFWSWLTEYKNNYILKKKYSLPRAFRIYEFEKDISTFKVNGNKIDDLVENIKCDKEHLCLKLPKRMTYSYEITNDQFNAIEDLIHINTDDNYSSLLITSLLSIVPPNTFSNIDYYEMIIREYFGSQWELFERYRAFFKLIFL